MAAAIIVLAGAACLAINWPGHFSWDSVMQLAEGRAGVYSGQHPPIMSWLLGLADAGSPGGGLFVVLDVALVAVCLPQLAIYPAIVWKDVLFAGAAVAGFAALAVAAAHWASPGWRRVALILAALLLALASLTRQNGALVLPFAALALAWIAGREGGVRAALGHGAAFLGGAVLLAVIANLALATRVRGSHGVPEQWEHLAVYDIVGAVARDPRVELGVLHARAPWIETLLRDDGAPAYRPSRIDALGDDILDPIDARADAAAPIFAQWRDLIAGHPLLYLRVRASVFRWTLLTPKPAECVMVSTGVDGDPVDLAAAGLKERQTPRDDAIEAYATAFTHTPAYSHLTYGLAGAALLALLLRRRRTPDIAVAAMVAAALAFAASFAVIGIACDYRYLYDLDLSAVAAALYGAATRVWRVGQPGAAGPHEAIARNEV